MYLKFKASLLRFKDQHSNTPLLQPRSKPAKEGIFNWSQGARLLFWTKNIHSSSNFESGPLNVRFPALRAATRPGKTLPSFKNIPAFQAQGRLDDELFSLRGHRACNMGEMLIDLLFPDPKILRQFNGVHLHFTQNFYKLLPDRFHFTRQDLQDSYDQFYPVHPVPVFCQTGYRFHGSYPGDDLQSRESSKFHKSA